MQSSQTTCCRNFIVMLSLVVSGMLPCCAESPADSKADQAAQRDRIHLANLSRIAIALRKFDDQHGHFPLRVRRSDTGQPLLSWRAALLPYLGHADLHDRFRFDEPWNSEHNRSLIRQMPDVFDVGVYTEQGKGAAAGYTHAVVPVMQGSVWHDDEDQSRTIYDIHDGSISTLAVFAAPPSVTVVWTKPDDLSLNPDNIAADMFGESQYCQLATFDGAKYRIAKPASNSDLKAFITFDGREEVVWNNLMPWLKTRRTSSPPRSIGQLSDNTTDSLLERRLTRSQYLTDVTRLNLSHTQVTAAGLRHLRGLPALKRITLNDTQATDAGLEQLKGVPTLESLDLRDAPVTDVGLEHLGQLTHLNQLLLDRTKITDAGLAHLEGLTALEQLWLWNTPVTDAGLKHLRGLSNLKKLNLSGTDVSDAGLENLREFTNLELLILTRTQVAGPGLKHLQGMTKLKSLFLDQTSVSDSALEYLKSLPNLKWLDVRYTQVSDDAAKALKSTLPNKCHVFNRLFDPTASNSMSFGLDGRSGATGTIELGIWKLYARSGASEIALFDLSKDLREQHNIVTDHPEIVARLMADLREWVSMTGSSSKERKEWLRRHSIGL